MIHAGNLLISTQADADRYAELVEVTGDLSILVPAKLTKLKTVGGYVSIAGSGRLYAPRLEGTCGDLNVFARKPKPEDHFFGPA